MNATILKLLSTATHTAANDHEALVAIRAMAKLIEREGGIDKAFRTKSAPRRSAPDRNGEIIQLETLVRNMRDEIDATRHREEEMRARIHDVERRNADLVAEMAKVINQPRSLHRLDMVASEFRKKRADDHAHYVASQVERYLEDQGDSSFHVGDLCAWLDQEKVRIYPLRVNAEEGDDSDHSDADEDEDDRRIGARTDVWTRARLHRVLSRVDRLELLTLSREVEIKRIVSNVTHEGETFTLVRLTRGIVGGYWCGRLGDTVFPAHGCEIEADDYFEGQAFVVSADDPIASKLSDLYKLMPAPITYAFRVDIEARRQAQAAAEGKNRKAKAIKPVEAVQAAQKPSAPIVQPSAEPAQVPPTSADRNLVASLHGPDWQIQLYAVRVKPRSCVFQIDWIEPDASDEMAIVATKTFSSIESALGSLDPDDAKAMKKNLPARLRQKRFSISLRGAEMETA